MSDKSPRQPPRRRAASSSGGRFGDRLGRLEAAMQQVAEGVVIVDQKGRFVFWNQAAPKIVGMGPLDAPPREWSVAYGCFLPDKVTPYPPDQLPLARAMPGEHVREAEMFIRNPGNPEGAWISINSAPLRDEQGAPAGGVIVFRDVTAHRRADEVVRQLSKAIERTTDAVFITDRNGVIEYVNPAFETITGYTGERALGQRPSILKSGRVEPGFYTMTGVFSAYGRYDHDLANDRLSRAQIGLRASITPRLGVTLESITRTPRISYNSIFTAFVPYSTQELEAGVEYEFLSRLRAYGRVANIQVSDELGYRWTLGVNSGYGTVSYSGCSGYIGQLQSVSLFGNYPLLDNRVHPAGRSRLLVIPDERAG